MSHFAPIFDIPPFPCDPQVWQRFLEACRNRHQSPGAVLRALVLHAVEDPLPEVEQAHPAGKGKDPAVLRGLLAEALSRALRWHDLQRELDKSGLAFVPGAFGLDLVDIETEEVLGRDSQFGPCYADLVRRFGCGFPAHPSPGLASLALWALE